MLVVMNQRHMSMISSTTTSSTKTTLYPVMQQTNSSIQLLLRHKKRNRNHTIRMTNWKIMLLCCILVLSYVVPMTSWTKILHWTVNGDTQSTGIRSPVLLLQYHVNADDTIMYMKQIVDQNHPNSMVRRRRRRRLLQQKQEKDSGTRGDGHDDTEQQPNTNENEQQQQHHATSYAQRHPNNNNNYYYYSNGNRIHSSTTTTSTTTAGKSSLSYYDYNDDDNNQRKKQRTNHIQYTTQLSDVYWCLFIALGWSIWMIHTIMSLRQHYHERLHYIQNYYSNNNTSPNTNRNGITTSATNITSPCNNNNHNSSMYDQRLFQQPYDTLLLVRGHVLDIIVNQQSISTINTTTTPTTGEDAAPVAGTMMIQDDTFGDAIIKSSTYSNCFLPICTVVIDYVVERQPITPTVDNNSPTTSPQSIQLSMSEQPVPTKEYIQIRKHFETTMKVSDIEIGFANIEILVLPSDPMCSMIKYDYDTYVRQEETDYILLQKQIQRRRRRKQQQRRQQLLVFNGQQSSPNQKNNIDPMKDSTTSTKQISPIQTSDHMLVADDNDDDDDDDELFFGCDMCCDYANSIDTYQWKRLSLCFAILLVVASILGCIHVVSCMDDHTQWIGWMTLCIGLLLLFPCALYIHKIILLCHHWIDVHQQPEKYGYIVQSSTTNNCSNISSPTNTHKNKGIESSHVLYPTSLSDAACYMPSCVDVMKDVWNPDSSYHHHHMTTMKPTTTTMKPSNFSYVVPEMSGCYFIHYPTKHNNNNNKASSSNTKTTKRTPSSKADTTPTTTHMNLPRQQHQQSIEPIVETSSSYCTASSVSSISDDDNIVDKT